MISQEQRIADNAALHDGMVNRCAGTLQLSPVTMHQLIGAILALLICLTVWLLHSFELAIIVFIVLFFTYYLVTGKSFGETVEKLKKTRTFYTETPVKAQAPDGFPVAKFTETNPIQIESSKHKKLHSIEQAFEHLRFYGSYELDGEEAGFYALHNGYESSAYFVYGFLVKGFSPCMDHTDCMESIIALKKAVKGMPNLKAKFIWDIPADGSAQIAQQKRILDLEGLDPFSKAIAMARGKWAVMQERKGRLVSPTLRVYVRVKVQIGQEDFTPQDWKDRWVAKLAPAVEQMFGDTTRGTMFLRSMCLAYESGCASVLRAFNEGANLGFKPMTVHDLYRWDYAQIHNEPVEECPQYVRIAPNGVYEHENFIETPEGQKPVVPHHILGELFKSKGVPSVPCFYRKDMWLPDRGKLDKEGNPQGLFMSCIRLTQMEGYSKIRKSHAVGHIQNSYRWMEGLSNVQFITEVEAVNPLEKKGTLDKGIKQRTKLSNRALEKQTQDVDALEDIGDLLEARRLFRDGEKTLSTSTLIWVYADTKDELKLQEQQVIGRIGDVNCKLVQDCLEQRWIDSQPYAWEAMSAKPNFFRPEYMIDQTLPLVPWTQPQPLDTKGIGYIGRRISVQYFIDYAQKKNHTFISAKSGAGKSLQSLEVPAYCIAHGVPGIMLDSPPVADTRTGEMAPSTYAPSMELWRSLGVNVAYQDIKTRNFNVISRKGVGKKINEIEGLIDDHREMLLALVIGDNNQHEHKENAENLITMSYRDFLVNTQNLPENGEEPILVDYLKHFNSWSKRYIAGDIDMDALIGTTGLGKYQPTAKEQETIGFIRAQLTGVLTQPWGKRINAQTDFDTDVLFLVLGLTDIKSGSKEGLVYALAALSFMARMTSRFQNSVFGLDEGSTLMPMDAFASRFSRIFPEGRKKGANGFLITTELNSLLNSPYCGAIMDNFDNALLGYSEQTSISRFVEHLHVKEEIMRNYTKAPDRTNMASQWYLKRGDEHLEVLYYTTSLLLGVGATSPKESEVRRLFAEQHPDLDLLSFYELFGKKLYSAYSKGRNANSILR